MTFDSSHKQISVQAKEIARELEDALLRLDATSESERAAILSWLASSAVLRLGNCAGQRCKTVAALIHVSTLCQISAAGFDMAV